jgi:cyclophilin family peptidyl-prolyl cis-trans isomerase
VSKKQHKKQVQQARDRRRQQAFVRKQRRQRIIILVMVALMVLSLVAVGLGSLFADDPGTPEIDALDEETAAETADPEAADEAVAAAEPCPPAEEDVPTPVTEVYDDPPRFDLDPALTYVARLETTCGEIAIELDAEGAPRAVENFLALSEDGYYDGVVFHRVIDGFVIQAGDPAGTGCGQPDCASFDPDAPSFPGYTIADEASAAEDFEDGPQGGVLYPRGTVAMARTEAPDSAGSQFFVVQGDPIELPSPDYAVLGATIDGMEVVDRIAGQATEAQDRPVEDIAIVAVTVSTD